MKIGSIDKKLVHNSHDCEFKSHYGSESFIDRQFLLSVHIEFIPGMF